MRALCVLLLSARLSAAEAAPADVLSEDPLGADLYRYYCATCHGTRGAGDGPFASYLTIKVPALDTIRVRNAGVFPMLEVIRIIDGRARLAGHGGAMPVFGAVMKSETLEAFGSDGAEIDTRGRILSIALFLEQIQR